jgi:DnaK suppressor protein
MPNANNNSNSKLTSKKIEYFKQKLMILKEQKVGDIKTMTDESQNTHDNKNDSGHALHMADVATDMYDKEFSLGLASKDRELLSKIDAALKRIDQGTYGICLGTGKPIALSRLEAIPYAEYCLEYQEELDKRRG